MNFATGLCIIYITELFNLKVLLLDEAKSDIEKRPLLGDILGSKTTKLILLDSLLQEIVKAGITAK